MIEINGGNADNMRTGQVAHFGYTEQDGALHFDGVPVDQYDDGLSPADRKSHYQELIERYTNRYRVYCAICGSTAALEKMAVCRTCGDAFCASCCRGKAIYRNPRYGAGFVCPTCRNEGRFGLAA